jgi:drug/metabolite transporter (DMT)-like permease
VTWPVLAAGAHADWLATAALLLAPISWAIGAAIQQRNASALSPRVASGYQQLLSCAGFAILAVVHGEPLPHPGLSAWWGWGFLVLFGSILAFTSFVSALRLLPMPVVMTYAYVNPVIAVVIGWWLLDEPVTGPTLAGMALILLGVAGVLRDRFAPR